MLQINIFRFLCLLAAQLFFTNGYAQSIELSNEERRWLANHPILRIAPDPDFAPFEWLDEDGNHQGIAADYVKLIEKKLGIRFEIIRTSKWSEVIRLAQQRKVDVLPSLALTKQRQAYLKFTHAYEKTPGVVISSQRYRSIDALQGKKVAVVRDSYWNDILSDSGTSIDIHRVDDIKFGLELTSLGAVDAMITDLASASNAIDQSGISNLNIVYDPENKIGSLEHAMAVRSDWPELRSILDKALTSIKPETHQQIRTKWIQLKPPSFWLDRTFLLSLAIAFALIMVIFPGFIIWNRMLKRKVKANTHALHIAQTKLMQAEKMESIGRLAAGIAHEVKNPLAIIQMGTDYLSGFTPKDQTSREVVADINDAINRANTVVHGLLDFSRDKKLTLVSANINDTINSALHLVEHELNQRNIRTLLKLSSTLSDVSIDSIKMQQVFINLFMNAAHAMEHNGTLEIRSEMLKVDDSTWPSLSNARHDTIGENIIRIQVLDTGPGILPQDKAKIFELFYTTKAIGEGSGLGLSVTRNILHLHHGTIEIDNRPEGGACITILLRPQKLVAT